MKRFKKRQIASHDPTIRFCVAPDCQEFVKLDNAYQFCKCICGVKFCARCNQIWHPKKTCEEAMEFEFKNYSKENII